MNENNYGDALVSVIMPAYNCECFIEEAIRSVMAQTYPNWELIVINDCSQDKTGDVVGRLMQEDMRIRLYENECNLGAARSRNRGFELCNGQYVALLDSDDLWVPEKLQVQLQQMQQENADLCYTTYEIIDQFGEKAKKDYIVPARLTYEELLKENVIGCSTVLFSRSILNGEGFTTDFYHEDYVLWLRLLRQGCTAVGCTQALVKWRFIANSRSYDKRKSAGNRWRIYREYLRLSVFKSLQLFSVYALRGLKKYF